MAADRAHDGNECVSVRKRRYFRNRIYSIREMADVNFLQK